MKKLIASVGLAAALVLCALPAYADVYLDVTAGSLSASVPLCTYYCDTGQQFITPSLYVENCGAFPVTVTERSEEIRIIPEAISLQPGKRGVSILSPNTQAPTEGEAYKHPTHYYIMLGASDHV